jgi:hypothetical protein
MISLWTALIVFLLTFVSGLAGLYLQHLPPEPHTVANARDMIGSVMGLVTLLLALVLGTIIGSAYFFSSTQQSELQTLSARAIQLDQALADYGPETKPVRDRLKQNLAHAYDLFWASRTATEDDLSVANALNGSGEMNAYLNSLDPKTPAQKQAAAAASANFAQIAQTRLLMSLQLANPFSKTLLTIVVFWSLVLFLGFGLLSKPNIATLVALAFGALAVSGAIFLILELSTPYTGLFRMSPAALVETIAVIDK